MFDSERIIDLYSSYGFEYQSAYSRTGILVFTITQSVFQNAIVVYEEFNEGVKKTSDDLSDVGYQVKIERINSVKDAESRLFNGFFSVKKTKRIFAEDYNKHISNIKLAFPADDIVYSYLRSPFSRDSQLFTANDNILDFISGEVNAAGPKLILLEAAAGFGKTCTAYEIGKIISEQDDDHIVLFAELSRDRQAKIFIHVLHNELSRSFPVVSVELVIREIKKGKIVVILDGFDELLNEKEDENFQFEKSQAMLETIGNILEGDAKVVLTTRKTAILQGDQFDDWICSNAGKFDFTRYSIKAPSPQSWLGEERYRRLSESRVNIKNISNPVLLTFLRFVESDSFNRILESPDSIVDKYFDLLLGREKKRQNLKMEIDEQVDLMKRLAKYMVLKNFTRETKDNIVSYFSRHELLKIEEVRSRYSGDEMPTFENVLERLSNHALLDRSAIDDKIGFVNNFVLGSFVAMDINETNEEWLAESIFVEAAVNAYSAKTLIARETMWQRLQPSISLMSAEDSVRLEMRLLDRVSGIYKSKSFTSVAFEDIDLCLNAEMVDCFFSECSFKGCTFDFSKLRNSFFVHCDFYECTSTGSVDNNKFISCGGDEKCFWLEHDDDTIQCQERDQLQNNVLPEDVEVRAFILEKFWPSGRTTIAFAHRPMIIFYRSANFSPERVTAAFDEMRKEGLLIPARRKNWIGLNMSGDNFNVIREVLGR